jgi:hypothetical protein
MFIPCIRTRGLPRNREDRTVTRDQHAIDLMVDSGAYSVFKSKAVPINLDDYIVFCRRNERWIKKVVNLDRIPDKTLDPGSSARLSRDNWLRMLDAGIDAMPVFHNGEHFSWLEQMLKDGATYVGVSPIKTNVVEARDFLDTAFSMLCDGTGTPMVKVHCLGITKPEFIRSYPFYTVDSTTWVKAAGYASVYIPQEDDGQLNYLDPHIIYFPRKVTVRGRSIDGYGDVAVDYIEMLVKQAGLSLIKVRNDPAARRHMNLMYFMRLADALGSVQFTRDNGHRASTKFHGTPVQHCGTSVYYATQLSADQSESLYKLGVRHVLLSFAELRKKRDDKLREYVEAGVVQRSDIRRRIKLGSAEWLKIRALQYERRANRTSEE